MPDKGHGRRSGAASIHSTRRVRGNLHAETTMVESVDRDLGRLEEKAASTERRLQVIEAQLALVLETLQHARGGWRMLMVVGGACAAIGSGITAVWASMAGKH
jgi:hypothetical protein